MSSKKKTTNPTALRIGSRVRCTDDGVEGRIVWANGVSVKIAWDDGEQVTWRRQALVDKPIEFLDTEGDQAEAPAASTLAESPQPPQAEAEAPPATTEQAAATEAAVAEPAPLVQKQAPSELPEAEAPAPEPQAADNGGEPAPQKPTRQRKAPAEPKGKKVSALDAAARVLAEENRPMTCKEMIDAMAAKGYWTSPKGATPAATLYSALLREMTTKGAAARFVKTDRGQFACNPGA
jgi:hypothetical protein